MLELIKSWWAIVPYAAVFFTLLYIAVPAIYFMISYLTFVGKGNGFDEYDIEDDEVWIVMDEIFTQIQVYNLEDGLFAVFVLWVLSTLLWFLGLPFAIFFMSILNKRVKTLKYDNTIKRNTTNEDD